jgi:hypothetical protein
VVFDVLSSQGGAWTVLLVGAAFIIGGLQLGSSAGRFPIMLGGTTVILAVLEIVGAAFTKASDREKERPVRIDREEVKAIAWIFLTIGAIYVSGILIGAFISTVLFCRFIERRTVFLSTLISATNVFVIWFAFSYLAKFTLYRGAIF